MTIAIAAPAPGGRRRLYTVREVIEEFLRRDDSCKGRARKNRHSLMLAFIQAKGDARIDDFINAALKRIAKLEAENVELRNAASD